MRKEKSSEVSSLDPDLCIGVITSVHGVKGYVKIRTFTDEPSDIEQFSHIFDDAGASYELKIKIPKKDYIIASIEGVISRNHAEKLRNTKLFIKRSELPDLSQDEFYHADLIGMEAVSTEGDTVGIVKNITNFGAGDILEIYDLSSEKVIFFPFKKQFVPAVDVLQRKITLNPLEEMIAGDEYQSMES